MEPYPHAQAPLTQSDSRWRPAHQKWLRDEDTAQHGECQQVQPAHTLRRVEPVPRERAAISACLPVRRDAAPKGPRSRDGVTTGGKQRCDCSGEEAVGLGALPFCPGRGGVLSVGRGRQLREATGHGRERKSQQGDTESMVGMGAGMGA